MYKIQAPNAYCCLLNCEKYIKHVELIHNSSFEPNVSACSISYRFIRKVTFLRLKDGELENNREFRKILVRVLRQYRPDVVLSMDPANLSFENVYVGHADHRAAGLAVFDAVYPAARNRNFFPELLEEGLMPHAVSRIYFFGTADPNTWIDIGETIEAKIEALRAHKSQVGEFEDLSVWVRERFGQLGKEKGVAYAEAFRQLEIP